MYTYIYNIFSDTDGIDVEAKEFNAIQHHLGNIQETISPHLFLCVNIIPVN